VSIGVTGLPLSIREMIFIDFKMHDVQFITLWSELNVYCKRTCLTNYNQYCICSYEHDGVLNVINGLVWTIFNEGAYLTFKSIFDKALN